MMVNFFHSNYLKPFIFPKRTIQNLAIFPENSPTAAQQKLRARHGTKNFGPGQNVTNWSMVLFLMAKIDTKKNM